MLVVSFVGLQNLNAKKVFKKQLQVVLFHRINTTGQIQNNVIKGTVPNTNFRWKEITLLRNRYIFVFAMSGSGEPTIRV
jgi:hypothetical protein